MSDEDQLLEAEKMTRTLLESHFKGRASFPTISAQRRTSKDDESPFVQIMVVFDGDTETQIKRYGGRLGPQGQSNRGEELVISGSERSWNGAR